MVVALTQRGTPQGGVLSPYLWNVYFNTLLSQDWAKDDVAIQAYADDLVIWAASADSLSLQRKLQAATARLDIWGQQKAMRFQPDKTRVMPFRYRGAFPQISIQMQGMTVATARTIKYLGITVDARHNWLPHLRSLVSRVNTLACRFLPTVCATRPIPRAVARRIYAAAAMPVMLYGHGIWGSASAKRGVAKLLGRTTRPFLLALVHTLATAATSLLNKLAALPDVQTAGEIHTMWLIASIPDLRALYLIPWAATPMNNRRLHGQPLRKHIYSILDKHAAPLHQLARCEPDAKQSEPPIASVCISHEYDTQGRRSFQERRRWQAGNWILTSWQHNKFTTPSIIIHSEPPNHSSIPVTDTFHYYTTPTWLPYQFLQAFTQHIRSTSPPQYTTPSPILLLLHAPTLSIALNSPTLIQKHWKNLHGQQHFSYSPPILQIQPYSNSNPPRHPLWQHLTSQHFCPTTPFSFRVFRDSHTNQQQTTTQHLAQLKYQLKLHQQDSLLSIQQNNRILKEFFPTAKALLTYATTDKLSWALGLLITDQHPLKDHLYHTNRASSNVCPACNTNVDTVEHFLCYCPAFTTHRAE